MAGTGATENRNAKCLTGTSDTLTFQNYIQTCRTASDTRRATNFFSDSIQTYKDTFANLRAQYDDLSMTGDSMNSLMSLTGTSVQDADKQIDTLTKRKDMLLAEITEYRRIGGAADRSFLEDVMQGRYPQKEVAPSLQDVSLLLFWFGWVLLSVVLLFVRIYSPGGNWRSGLFVFTLLLLVTVCIYAILKQVA